MALRFLETYRTPEVRAAQEHYYGRAPELSPTPEQDPLTPEEIEFIAQRDSFYLASVSGDGWPYVQHRGGPRGFLKVLSPSRLAFADYRGNRQLLSTGNLATNDRVMLFLMDYPRRERLKIVGHARTEDARARPELLEGLVFPEERAGVERVFVVEVLSHDWNCSKFITPRFTAEEVETAVAPLKQRIAELEARLAIRPPDER